MEAAIIVTGIVIGAIILVVIVLGIIGWFFKTITSGWL